MEKVKKLILSFDVSLNQKYSDKDASTENSNAIPVSFTSSQTYFSFFYNLIKENITSRINELLENTSRNPRANIVKIPLFNLDSFEISSDNKKLELPISLDANRVGRFYDKNCFTLLHLAHSDEYYKENEWVWESVFCLFELKPLDLSLRKVEGRLFWEDTTSKTLPNALDLLDVLKSKPRPQFQKSKQTYKILKSTDPVKRRRNPTYFIRLAFLDSFLSDIRNLDSLEETSFPASDQNKNIIEMLTQPEKISTRFVEDLWGKLPEHFRTKLLSRELNKSQHMAVENCCRSAFSLMQGPPGTGKTKTVLALLNAAHLALYHNFYSKSDSFNQRPRLLVCAPSNSAVDELVHRFVQSNGFFDGLGNLYQPEISRIGFVDKMKENLRQCVTLSGQVSSFLERFNGPTLDEHISFVQESLRTLAMTKTTENKEAHEEERVALELAMERLIILKTYFGPDCDRRRKEAGKTKLEASFLANTQVVFSTLAACCHPSVLKLYAPGKRSKQQQLRFDLCIVDEAAQATETEVLCALRLAPKRVVLVGDPQQLPATVFIDSPNLVLLERSMFQRLAEGGVLINFLNMQYRMHPTIAEFPSSYFYDNKLVNGANVVGTEYHWELHKTPPFRPLAFFDARGTMLQNRGNISNTQQAVFIIGLLKRLAQEHYEVFKISSENCVTVLTPYQGQKSVLCELMKKEEKLKSFAHLISISTVDNFQGQESPFVIFSTVRTERRSIGFVKDIRRMNVALTRAKFGLWVVGDEKALRVSPDWNVYLDYLKENKYITYYNVNEG